MSTLGRSDLRAGVLTMLTITVLSVGIMWLPSVLDQSRIRYELAVAPTVDLTGLSVGAPVQVGGIERGRVVSIKGDQARAGEFDAIVTIEIRRDPPIYPQARPVLRTNPISQKAIIDFQNVGNPGVTRAELEESSRLELVNATETESIFSGEMGKNLQRIGKRLNDVPAAWGSMQDSAPARFANVRDEFLAVRDEIDATWSETSERAQALIDRYRRIGDEFSSLAEEAKSLRAEFDHYRAMNAEGGAIPRLRTAFDRVSDSWRLLRVDIDALRDVIDRFQSHWSRASGGISATRAKIDEIVALFDLGPILADVTIAGNLFSKIYSEAIAAPWRVVFPNESAAEARRNQLDDLVRVLLENAETAKRARTSIEEILQAGKAAGADAEAAIERIRQQFDGLSALEEALWKTRFGTERSP